MSFQEDIQTEPSALAVRVGQKIRAARKASGLTLLQLAAKCRTTPQTIQRLEVASMTISLDWVERIAKALDVKPISFFDTDASMVNDVRGAAKILQKQVSTFLDMTRPD